MCFWDFTHFVQTAHRVGVWWLVLFPSPLCISVELVVTRPLISDFIYFGPDSFFLLSQSLDRERKGEREKHQFVVPLTYAFTG